MKKFLGGISLRILFLVFYSAGTMVTFIPITKTFFGFWPCSIFMNWWNWVEALFKSLKNAREDDKGINLRTLCLLLLFCYVTQCNNSKHLMICPLEGKKVVSNGMTIYTNSLSYISGQITGQRFAWRYQCHASWFGRRPNEEAVKRSSFRGQYTF